jgi:hypothetical protein
VPHQERALPAEREERCVPIFTHAPLTIMTNTLTLYTHAHTHTHNVLEAEQADIVCDVDEYARD